MVRSPATTAIITGASRGIGAALRTELTQHYTRVVGTCRGTPPDGSDWLTVDVTDPATIRSSAVAFGDGPLDLLVCNAGTLPDRAEPLDTGYPSAMWADAFAVNVTGVFLTIQAFLPNLRRASGAKIAIISSQMGSTARAPGGTYIYRASKAAVLNLGRNIAVDLRAEGIAVGVYHPGWVRTAMGGSGAEITPQTSANGLAARVAALSPQTTGCFETWDGKSMPF
jgi:NAD(P)-dependent dehydrogenase (short-subunit alcohol dehydrogenase family)